MKNCRNCGGAPRPNRDACVYCGTAFAPKVDPQRNDDRADIGGRRWAEDMARAFALLSTPTPGQRMTA